ncbi:MAG: NifB/NifX family molybdenum-iron cluster-binding protein [Colwellia sp.]
MKVALLTAQSRVSPVFETTCRWFVINATKNRCVIRGTYYFNAQNEVAMANELLIENIQLIICGAIPYYLEKLLVNQGCDVLSFIAGDVDEVLQALRYNLLDDPKFKMPGCKKRKRRRNIFFCKRNMNEQIDTQ